MPPHKSAKAAPLSDEERTVIYQRLDHITVRKPKDEWANRYFCDVLRLLRCHDNLLARVEQLETASDKETPTHGRLRDPNRPRTTS